MAAQRHKCTHTCSAQSLQLPTLATIPLIWATVTLQIALILHVTIPWWSRHTCARIGSRQYWNIRRTVTASPSDCPCAVVLTAAPDPPPSPIANPIARVVNYAAGDRRMHHHDRHGHRKVPKSTFATIIISIRATSPNLLLKYE